MKHPLRSIAVLPLLATAYLLVTPVPGVAEEAAFRYWPSWRGPHYNGTSRLADPPTTWSEENNIAWKIEVPGRGLASPVVWGDHIFLLTSVPVEASHYE
ncbi:MAG: hypothetical protein P8Y44_12820, partial [Acidobacteriota bacterium]